MICPMNAGGLKTRQCVGERCAWFIALKSFLNDEEGACSVPLIAYYSAMKSFGNGLEQNPKITKYEEGKGCNEV